MFLRIKFGGHIEVCNILNIMVDDNTQDQIEATEKIEIGILLDTKVSKKHNINLYNEKIP